MSALYTPGTSAVPGAETPPLVNVMLASERPAGDGAHRRLELAEILRALVDQRAQCCRHLPLELVAARRAHRRDHRVQLHTCQNGVDALVHGMR